MTNTSLFARRQAAVPRGVASATQVFASKAENAEVWDTGVQLPPRGGRGGGMSGCPGG